MSRYAHLFLGSTNDPQPVFRDVSPDGVWHKRKLTRWPAKAVFAVTFATEAALCAPGERFTEFFDEDGWPVDFPPDRRSLGLDVKREFQLHHWRWRSWDRSAWKIAEVGMLTACRVQAAVIRGASLAV